FSHERDEAPFLFAPRVFEIDLLSSFHGLDRLARMQADSLDLSREVLRVAELEKMESIVAEVVLDPACLRSDHWSAKRQVFENARRHVDLGECATTVRDDADVALLDRPDQTFRELRSQVANCL